MKYFLALTFVLFLKVSTAADIIDDISVSLKSGNVKELSKYFSATLELNILNDEEIYSSIQAELVLKNFFDKHDPISGKVIHKVISNANYKFGVVVINTSNGNFRISYELKNTGGKFLITQIRIEESKE